MRKNHYYDRTQYLNFMTNKIMEEKGMKGKTARKFVRDKVKDYIKDEGIKW